MKYHEIIETIDNKNYQSVYFLSVYYRIKEGNKERIQFFKGDVLQRKGSR